MNQPNKPQAKFTRVNCSLCGGITSYDQRYHHQLCYACLELSAKQFSEINKPQNPDSLHVGETVENPADITNSPEWKAGIKFLEVCRVTDEDERFLRFYDFIAGWNGLKQQLSEAGESKWIDVKIDTPKKEGRYYCCYTTRQDKTPHCSILSWKLILGFNGQFLVTHWQPLPSAPNESKESEHMIMPCCAKCGGILIGIWETENKICSGSCRGKSKGTFEKLYTHEQVLAFGEKVIIEAAVQERQIAMSIAQDFMNSFNEKAKHKQPGMQRIICEEQSEASRYIMNAISGRTALNIDEPLANLINLSIDLNKIEIK